MGLLRKGDRRNGGFWEVGSGCGCCRFDNMHGLRGDYKKVALARVSWACRGQDWLSRSKCLSRIERFRENVGYFIGKY